MKFLSVEEVRQIHDMLIKEFGGSKGVTAVSRMHASFDGKELYTSIFAKAAALFESLCKNHPFLDGNKRTAFVSAATFLEINGIETNFNQEEAEEFILKVATQKVEFKEIVKFFKYQ